MSVDTPKTAKTIEKAIWRVLTGVWTAIPGEVVRFDAQNRMVDVQPTLKRKVDGEVESRGQVHNVPVFYITGGGFTATHPLEKGDEVAVIFSMRSIDRWLEEGGEVDPKDGRKFHPSDGLLAFPKPSSKPNATPVEGGVFYFGKEDGSTFLKVHESDDIEASNGTAFAKVNSDGTIELGQDAAELVNLTHSIASDLQSLISGLQSAVTATVLGPQPLDPATQTTLGNLVSSLGTLISKLEMIKA